MLLVEKYSSLKHEKHLEKFLQERSMSTALIHDLPQEGLVVSTLDEPIAMGFIRQIEGPYAMLDSYITSPKTPGEIRDEALDLLTDKLIGIAKERNISKLLAFSADENTMLRSVRHGFVKLPNVLTILPLQ